MNAQDLDDLDALLLVITPAGASKAPKTKSPSHKPVVKFIPKLVPALETPRVLGLTILTKTTVCGCCSSAEVTVIGQAVKYQFKGATSLRPLSEVTSVDYARLVNDRLGTREIEDTPARIAYCVECSKSMLSVWNNLGFC